MNYIQRCKNFQTLDSAGDLAIYSSISPLLSGTWPPAASPAASAHSACGTGSSKRNGAAGSITDDIRKPQAQRGGERGRQRDRTLVHVLARHCTPAARL